MTELRVWDRVYRKADAQTSERIGDDVDTGEGPPRKGTVLSVGESDDGREIAGVAWDMGGVLLEEARGLVRTGHRHVALACGCAGVVHVNPIDGVWRVTRTGLRYCGEYLSSSCARVTGGGSDAALLAAFAASGGR